MPCFPVSQDDPICAAAKKDKKTLVTDLWVVDALDTGMLVDSTKVCLFYICLKCLVFSNGLYLCFDDKIFIHACSNSKLNVLSQMQIIYDLLL